MNYLRAFAPWIVYAVVPADYWQWAALAAALIALGEIVLRLRARYAVEGLIIDIGSLVYFTALCGLAFTHPDTPLHAYTPSLANGALAVIAIASLALRAPFTLGIAKQSTPPEFWDQPLFIRTGYLLTGVWTASFVLGCLTLALVAHAGPVTLTAVHALVFGAPAAFTVWYVARIRSRAASLLAAREGVDQAI
ncbi:hypothetical protein [Nocardia higoensis]|uniref:hypothetical protein n=1 Tax=Nocardia higoensis TaxID=228599 RepID=UPI0002EA9214|nr:hypothetical protein [Nocardia higoensis]